MIPEGWTERRLGDLFDVKSSKRVLQSDWRSSGVPFYRGREITELSKRGEVDNDLFIDRALFEELSSRFGVPARGDILVSAIGTIGNVFLVRGDHEFYFKDASVLWLSSKGISESSFVVQWMRSPGFQTQLPTGNGTTVDTLTIGILGDLHVPLPPLDEQQAIAEALSDAGALVDSLDALIAKKRDMKQAAMQRFMAPAPTLPGATRVRLGDVVQVRKGELITESMAIPGDVPVIAGGKEAAYHSARWNRDGLTITISASGANAGYVKLRKGRLWASDCSTISESPDYDIRYVAAQLEVRQSKLYQSQFGGAQPHVRPNDISAIEVCWVDVTQQQMIGEMIADMDVEIDALVAQREKADLVKQGMMQELLSGRVRLV